MSHAIRVARRLLLAVPLALALTPASAFGAGELVFEPDEVAFGQLNAGTQRTLPLTLRNVGSEAVTLGDAWLGYDESAPAEPFSADIGSCGDVVELAADATCEMTVTFTAPQQPGSFEAIVVFEGQEMEAAVALLTGESVPGGVLTVEPSSLDFGQVPVRSVSAQQAVRVRNVGSGPIAVPPPSMTNGVFSIVSSSCPPALEAGAECAVGVVFAPTTGQLVQTGHLVIGPRSSWTRTDGLSIALSGTVGKAVGTRDPAAMIESNLGTLADSLPKAVRGGPRRVRLNEFTAPIAGTLRLRVYGWPGRGRTLVASGERKLAASERHQLTVALTKKGRKLLRRPKRSRIKVIVSFTADADGQVSKQSPEYWVKPPKAKRPTKRR